MKFIGKLLKILVLTALGLFAGTFVIYMFNLENKLIYKVIYPFLQDHYNSQKRDRRICKKRYPPSGGYLFLRDRGRRHSVVWCSLPKCSSRMPSTSSQMAFRLQEPQSVGMPSRIFVRLMVMSLTVLASLVRAA